MSRSRYVERSSLSRFGGGPCFIEAVEAPSDAMGKPGSCALICQAGAGPSGSRVLVLEGQSVSGTPGRSDLLVCWGGWCKGLSAEARGRVDSDDAALVPVLISSASGLYSPRKRDIYTYLSGCSRALRPGFCRAGYSHEISIVLQR